MTLGQKIRAARQERGMTQKELVGHYITRNMLSKIENDSATPSVRTLEYLAQAPPELSARAARERLMAWLSQPQEGAGRKR